MSSDTEFDNSHFCEADDIVMFTARMEGKSWQTIQETYFPRRDIQAISGRYYYAKKKRHQMSSVSESDKTIQERLDAELEKLKQTQSSEPNAFITTLSIDNLLFTKQKMLRAKDKLVVDLNRYIERMKNVDSQLAELKSKLSI